ncbi:hypothetical protein JXB02_06225 [Candidatus Woesearchaeota archaeon]|nr:hypothetical protein [Candidatus Woesearchaeota archaeon]
MMRLPASLAVLKKRETKPILAFLEGRYGSTGPLDYVFLKNNRERVFIAKRDLFDLDLSRLRINSVGMYLAELLRGEVRLSIEGSQLVGPHATRNVLEIPDDRMRAYLHGEDLDIIGAHGCEDGYVLIRNTGDFFGAGRLSGSRLLNHWPKTRRLRTGD